MDNAPPADPDVIIAGGGPVGLAAAVELGQRGVNCLVIEPRVEVSTSRPRAKTTTVRTMEHFRRWGIAQRVRDAAYLPVAWSQTVVFCTTLMGTEVTRFDGVFGLRPTPRDEFAESGQQVPQFVVERVLRQVCHELPSVHLALGSRVIGVRQHEDGIAVDVVAPDGSQQTVESEFLVGADGAGSVVREAIGSCYSGRSGARPSLGIVFRSPDLYRLQPHGPAVHYWLLTSDAPGIMGRLDLESTWWAIATGADLGETPAEARTIVHRMIGAPIPIEVSAVDPWRSQMLIAAPQRVGRVFLVGDAAHQNPPFGGHGFNTGVGDAVNLGWKLAAVLQGWGGPGLLDSYELERRPVQEEVIRQATHNMGSLPGGLAADADVLQATKATEFYSLGLVLGYSYHGSPLVMDDGAPPPAVEVVDYHPTARPGARLPHMWLEPGVSLYDTLGNDFTLLRSDETLDHSLSEAFAAARVPLTAVTLPRRQMLGLFGSELLVVRPDQHVAWRDDGQPVDADALVGRVRGATQFDNVEGGHACVS